MNEEKGQSLCKYTNRGSKSHPYWYTADCCNRTVNVKKAMIKKRNFLDNCPFCGKIIEWHKAEKK